MILYYLIPIISISKNLNNRVSVSPLISNHSINIYEILEISRVTLIILLKFFFKLLIIGKILSYY